jgi:hypothetical protein
MANEINVGDSVFPKTPAGLCLGHAPANGTYNQKVDTTCVFRGFGKVIEVVDIVIDYDYWDNEYQEIGKVPYRNCLVECEAGTGWAGEGALVKSSP